MNDMTHLEDPILASLLARQDVLIRRIEDITADRAELVRITKAIAALSDTAGREGRPYDSELANTVTDAVRLGYRRTLAIHKYTLAQGHAASPKRVAGALRRLLQAGQVKRAGRGVWTIPDAAE